MKRVRNLYKVFALPVSLILFVGLLFVIFQNFIPSGLAPALPTQNPNLSAYPPPDPAPYPIPSPFSIEQSSPTAPPTWSPYPTNTALPGATLTPIPLLEPAKNSSGSIFYVIKDDQGGKQVKVVEVDEKGNVKNNPKKISDGFLDGTHYPSPNGKYVAIVGAWGVGGILSTSNGKYEPFSQSLGRINFFNWFPDNRQILFADEIGNLLLADPLTGEYIPIFVPTYGIVRGAAASPDGKYIVFAYDNGVEPLGIWIIDSQGRNKQLLSEGMGSNFSWSPNGEKIAFYAQGLEVMNADGSDRHSIDDKINLPLCYSLSPAWSPDSRNLAVVTSDPETYCNKIWDDTIFQSNSQIYVIDITASRDQAILAIIKNSIDPTWSPDGSQLVCISNKSGKPNLWILSKDGSDKKQLTDGNEKIRFPAWKK